MNIKYYLNNKEKIPESYDFFIKKEQLTKITPNKKLIDAHIKKAEQPPLGKVRVAVPNKTDNEAIKLFILSKSSWIKNK